MRLHRDYNPKDRKERGDPAELRVKDFFIKGIAQLVILLGNLALIG
jgi:hypothetical protein